MVHKKPPHPELRLENLSHCYYLVESLVNTEVEIQMLGSSKILSEIRIKWKLK